jgi:hypothetical protein
VNLIDEDARKFYWGNKQPDVQNGTKHAGQSETLDVYVHLAETKYTGTSVQRLAPVIFGEKYS